MNCPSAPSTGTLFTRPTGLPGALGLSMFAGSTEDGDAGSGLREGIVEGQVSVTERAAQGIIGEVFRLLPSV
jgi:hypothetical protein